MTGVLIVVEIIVLLSYLLFFLQQNDALKIIFPISVGSSPEGCVGVQPQANHQCLGSSCHCQLAAVHIK